MDNKPSILVFCTHYLPAYKAGGPIRSISNMVDALGDDISFFIVTDDRDLGDRKPFANINTNQWVNRGKAKVYYLHPNPLTFKTIRTIINTHSFDGIYINALFFPAFSFNILLLRRLRLVDNVPIIIAPRGLFSPGHLSIKRFKYISYILCIKILQLHRRIIWQASSEYEQHDIITWFGKKARVVIAPALPSANAPQIDMNSNKKQPGQLKLVFLSRISPMKNLDGALNMLKTITGDVTFTIFGPNNEPAYWNKCRDLINNLPVNIKALYEGPLSPQKVISELSKHDLFFLPTLGENYGHVIFEALSAGCPALISDQTPWRNLKQKGIGWDLPLNDVDGFRAVIQEFVNMDEDAHYEYSIKARNFCKEYVHSNPLVQMNKDLFRIAIGGPFLA